MTWFKVDDSFYDHPKRPDDLKAVGLWVLAGSYCAKHLTGGFFPASRLRALGGTPALARTLVSCGLWTETCRVLDGNSTKGWQFHDWEEYQPSRSDVQEYRKKERERKAAWRAAKSARQGETP